MADEIDRAQAETDFFLARAMSNRPKSDLQARGRCLFCEEKTAEGVRFCSAECRDDFDQLTSARMRSGQS